MEYFTKEFAAELGVSKRTVEDWRISRGGKPPRLTADHIDEHGRAVYTEAQLETARALLKLKSPQKTAATIPSLFDDRPIPETTTDDKPVEENETQAGTEIEETSPPVTIDADAQIVTLDQRADKIRRLQSDVQRGMIEIGRELLAAKLEIGHGNWTAWIETEFDWTDRTARYFMAVAERFGNRNTYSDLPPSTLKAMLALPVGTEDEFIASQEEAGKPVDKQSAREVTKNVKAWNEQRKPKPTTAPKQTHLEENTSEDDTIVAAQIDDDTAKLVVGDKPLDSCRGIVCIDEETQRDGDAQALLKARAIVQIALQAVSAAIDSTDDISALEAATQALNAIRAELDEKNFFDIKPVITKSSPQ